MLIIEARVIVKQVGHLILCKDLGSIPEVLYESPSMTRNNPCTFMCMIQKVEKKKKDERDT